MLYQLVFFFFLAFLSWMVWAYLQERKFRKKPFYGLSDIGWRTVLPPPASQRRHSIALVGDIGNAGPLEKDPVLKSIRAWQQEAGDQSTLIFLGDNIYPVGVPPEGHRHHARAMERLQYQFELFKSYQGKVIYLGGNHDWNKGRRNGFTYMLRQQEIITQHLNDPLAYLPQGGCLGPVTWEINEQVLLVIINTQWWVQRGFKPLGPQFGCDYASSSEFFEAFEKLLEANKHRFIVLAGHHPLYSNALHGGKFTVKQHLFPLTFVHKRALVPLPLVGTMYRLYRQYVGAHEDMSFPPFKRFRKKLLKILHRHSPVFYVAGHDHNLQYFQVKGNHYAVSGSGSKTSFVAKGGKATFSHENKGFLVLDHYQDGTIWLRVLEPNPQGEGSELVFRKCLHKMETTPQILPQ
ncbi:metallophosphoesterase [Rufibacter sp. LB8]|uniref:metallophosphoesterase n=1 Tax=Rufibacter sp. LB8 TaxID=2777781 RepID=UPI00178C25BE|nr:metallophosphoesterase [Rufibacter sp. LB8]